MRPVEETAIILGCTDGIFSRTLRKDWVTRLGGDMLMPLVSEHVGVPPGRCMSKANTVFVDIPTNCKNEKVNRPVIVSLLCL